MNEHGATAPGPAAAPPEPRPRVMAVDDQRDSLRLLQFRLQAANFECVAFSDGVSALEHLKKEMADIIILDVMMPVMDGYETCRRLKADERTRDIPVLFLTAKMDMEDKIKGLEAGGHDYLSKPVEQQELVARTRAALRVKHLQDELKKQLRLQQQINQLHQGMLSEHWQKTLGQLAASLAHEINNPLAVALGTVQLLGMEEDLPAEFRSRLGVVDESLQRAGRKLRSLLLIAHVSRQAQTVSLAQTVGDMLALINYQVVINKVALSTDLDPNCSWHGVHGDLARAILYILNNAVEAVAGRPDARIRVQIAPGPNGCQIVIEDNGPGVPPELREQIFAPFFTTKTAPHNGVGLYLANQIVKGIGGSISLCSRPETASTRFVILLPPATKESDVSQK